MRNTCERCGAAWWEGGWCQTGEYHLSLTTGDLKMGPQPTIAARRAESVSPGLNRNPKRNYNGDYR